jgi:hypothetical protein
MEQEPFSVQLERWLQGKHPKTIMGLSEVFAEKSFAIAFLILMAVPALPIPTGGITHLFEAIAMLLALELIVGRRTIWLPKRWEHTKIGNKTRNNVLPFLIRRIRWFEKFSRPRMSRLVNYALFRSLIGIVVLVFCLTAFLSPPFSGLDTIPSLGVVVLALGLILEDIIVVIMGLVTGVAGMVLTIGFGTLIVEFVTNLI